MELPKDILPNNIGNAKEKLEKPAAFLVDIRAYASERLVFVSDRTTGRRARRTRKRSDVTSRNSFPASATAESRTGSFQQEG
jgi:hypothetical protein